MDVTLNGNSWDVTSRLNLPLAKASQAGWQTYRSCASTPVQYVLHCIVIFCVADSQRPYLARIAGSLAPYRDVTRVPSRDRDWHPSSTWRPYPGESYVTILAHRCPVLLPRRGESEIVPHVIGNSPGGPRRVPWWRRAWASAAQCCVASVVGPRRMPDCLFGGPIINGPLGLLALSCTVHPIPLVDAYSSQRGRLPSFYIS